MSRNDITGDKLISKTNSKAYDDRYDLIFRKQVEDLDSTALDIADATVGHSNPSDEELEMISTRTKAALAVLKAKGVILGNQTNLDEARLLSNATTKEQAAKFADVVLPTVLQFRNQGDTLPVIADKLNNMGVKTRRGGKWYASTVTNILKRA